MNTSVVSFVVPRQPRELVDAILEHYGTVSDFHRSLDSGDDFPDVDEATQLTDHLSSIAGQVAEVEFEYEDNDETDDEVLLLAGILTKLDCPYIGCWPSYTERSRGERHLGGFLYDLGDGHGRRQRSFPWNRGEPAIDSESLRGADFPGDEITRIESRFFATGTGPSP